MKSKNEPTIEQQQAIDETDNCVILAKPGSGKTFTLSCKVKCILPRLPFYKGIIAISHTNKASDELRTRCLSNGQDKKGSFFGTIDSFFFREIIAPFGLHLFGKPIEELNVVKLSEDKELNNLNLKFEQRFFANICANHLPLLAGYYRNGKVALETFGFLGIYIFSFPNFKRFIVRQDFGCHTTG